ncbi:MAG: hypothetical protein PHH28_06905 [Desulfuromonadaceae bacterium]|nr:hypothetical protein [Desulfuromonadaceae bacterium]
MKCPKCGYNSFEYYDICKMCSHDLTGYKQIHSITSMVLPLEAKEKLAAELRSDESVTEQSSVDVETHDDIFSFDLPEDSASATPSHRIDDPFNFDELSPDTKQSSGAQSDEDIFADLLETTSQAEESPIASVKSAAAHASAVSPSPGEFDLESFSWDDDPTAATAADTHKSESVDDFDSLFGETKEKTSK